MLSSMTHHRRCNGLALTAFAATDPGTRRRGNEDRVLARLGRLTDSHAEAALVAVADGVGGAPSGDVASTIAVETLEKGFEELLAALNPATVLAQLFQQADHRVRDAGDRRPKQRGMACTLVAGLAHRGALWLASAGDSRAYLCHAGSLAQVTEDHSLAADASLPNHVRQLAGQLPYAQHVLTRSLGSSSGTNPDVRGPVTLEPGEWVLLCSDGLYNVVSDSEFSEALGAQAGHPETVANGLIALANTRGTPDNVSVVILKVDRCLVHFRRGG